jgi:multidrug efflux pump subunit AcrB
VWIVQTALRRPYTFVVLAFLIAIFGGLSAVRTPTDIFPNINIPVISVVWTYNGLLPNDMSSRVIYYYERTLTAQVGDIEHIESQSLNSYGVVKIFFQKDVNISAALAQVTAASQTVLKLLPPGITPPYVLSYNASSVPILQLALSSKKLPQMQLFDLGQNFIRPQLATVAGAAVPSPYGGKVLQVQVDLDQQAMQAHNVSADDVVNTISVQNLILPAGDQKLGKFDWNVSLNASPTVLERINDLPVKKVNGTIVYIRDVAFVHQGSPPQTNLVRVNGSRAVLMTILKAGSASTLSVIEGIKSLLPRVEESLPASLNLRAVGDQSVFVKAAVFGVIREAALAAALVGVMILIFLGSWRSTIIILIEIPLAILFALTALSWLGETINVMTLGGLALAVGILVDDGTVTIENINYHLEQGKQVEPAIMDGAQQIVIPAFVTLLCLCIVFVPMFQLGGVAGYLFRPMAEAVVFALLGSFILSRTLVPTLANYLLRAHDTGASRAEAGGAATLRSRNPFKRFQQGFEDRFTRVRERYRSLLMLALGRPKTFIAGFLACVVLSFGIWPFLGENFFPSVDSGQILMHIRAQPGTRIEETARLFDLVEQTIRNTIPPDQLDNIVDTIGLPFSGINMAYQNTGTIGPADGDALITLKEDHAPTEQIVKQLRSLLPMKFPGATFSFLPADIVSQILNFGLPAPIDVQVVGNNQAANYAYANELLKRIRTVPGIADPRIQQVFNYPQINVEVDRTLAGVVGLTQRDVANSLLVTLSGSQQVHPNFWLNPANGVSYPLVAQMPQYRIDTMSDLANVPVTSAGTKEPQYLGGLAQITPGPSAGVVSHYNVQPVIDIYGAIQQRDLGAVAADVNQILQDTRKDVPRGSYVVLRGQVQTMTNAYSQLYFGLAGAILLIYLVIVVNFQSWLDPFIIITALPAALAGIVWMLFITGTTLSVPALTGAIMCMGIATANSILLVSFAREGLAQGLDAASAALEAGFTRFRPVLMTALAMIIGMLPMAFALGEGGEQNAPLGRAVIGGLLVATVATLFFVPTVFTLLHSRRDARLAPGEEPEQAARPQHA